MKEIYFDALRWLEEPAGVKIVPNGGHPRVYFQITAPREIGRICCGRPVEELPRILSILSPAHHSASAMALDRLFNVEPPPAGRNIRDALLYTLFYENHLRKIYFLLSSWFDPLSGPMLPPGLSKGMQSSPHILDEIMRHVSIAQEAVEMLGGRSGFPISAVAGGMSRPLKEEYPERLAKIAGSCLGFGVRLSEFLRKEILGRDRALSEVTELSIEPMPSMCMPEGGNMVTLRDGTGGEMDRFSPEMIFQKVGLHRESWSNEPFAYLKEQSGGPQLKDRVGVGDLSYSQCFFVGPLARLNSGASLRPLAEAERERLLEDSGPLPHFSLSISFWALVVELLHVSECLVELCRNEDLTGDAVRTLPNEMGREGHAALESPKGLIYHHYTVDEKGLLEKVEILDTVAENNALRSLMIQKAADRAETMEKTTHEMKGFIELALLPF